jgi:hypothetical protein
LSLGDIALYAGLVVCACAFLAVLVSVAIWHDVFKPDDE